MVGCFVEIYRKGLKVNAGKSKMIMLGREEGLECEVYVNVTSKFKYKFGICFQQIRYR